MEFIPLHFGDKLTIINPQGTIGVVTLWSRPDYVIERFRQAGVDLDPATSPIAVFGTLYGNGLRELLRNLLYNPQIQVLLICGNDRSGSAWELQSFFDGDMQPVDSQLVRYKAPPGTEKVSILKISDTNRLIDDLVKPQQFKFYSQKLPEVGPVSGHDIQDDAFLGDVKRYFDAFINNPIPVDEDDRQEIPLPEVEVQCFPSNPRGHQVVRDTPLEAWKELLYLLSRFGRRVTLKKGDRLELQNIKVVVEKPKSGFDNILMSYNLNPEKFKKYQRDIVRSKIYADKPSLKGQARLLKWVQLRPDESYNYSERLRTHFELDTLERCVNRLKNDPEDRKAYITLWDNSMDLRAPSGHPCFVSLFFRKYDKKLTLTATFRTHNALDGWFQNFYGLIAIQKWVAKRIKMHIGPITVISHSISIDPRELDRALLIIGKRPFKVRLDPMGYFRITLDGKDILVEHRFEDVTLKEYRGRKAERLQNEIARDVALSDINHAIYLGRQLARAELALKEGREFVQD